MSAWRWNALVLLACFVVAAPASGAPSTRAIARQLASDASDDRALIIDESLSRAAQRHATRVAIAAEHATRAEILAALAKEGLADAQIIPFASRGSLVATASTARVFARDFVRGRGMTHVGVAYGGQPEKNATLVVLFVRRLAELSPLPRRVDRAPVQVVRGRIAAQSNTPRGFLMLPSGEVRTLDVQRADDSVRVDVPFQHGRGRYVLELLVDTMIGPEIAALWTFHYGIDPSLVVASKVIDREDEASLRDAIDRLRLAYGRSRLARDSRLDLAAKEHARAVCGELVAAHVSPKGSTPSSRARARGYSGSIAENVGIDASVAKIHQNLLESPSHRKNLLEPRARALGVGIVVGRQPGAPRCVVELFALDQE